MDSTAIRSRLSVFSIRAIHYSTLLLKERLNTSEKYVFPQNPWKRILTLSMLGRIFSLTRLLKRQRIGEEDDSFPTIRVFYIKFFFDWIAQSNFYNQFILMSPVPNSNLALDSDCYSPVFERQLNCGWGGERERKDRGAG